MSVSLFDLSVPTFLQTVRVIGECLDKANAHCSEIGADPDDFVTAHLVEGMAPFHFQIECVAHHSFWALETVKSGVFSAPALIGEMPSWPPHERMHRRHDRAARRRFRQSRTGRACSSLGRLKEPPSQPAAVQGFGQRRCGVKFSAGRQLVVTLLGREAVGVEAVREELQEPAPGPRSRSTSGPPFPHRGEAVATRLRRPFHRHTSCRRPVRRSGRPCGRGADCTCRACHASSFER